MWVLCHQYTDQLIPYPSQHSPPTSPLPGNTVSCVTLTHTSCNVTLAQSVPQLSWVFSHRTKAFEELYFQWADAPSLPQRTWWWLYTAMNPTMLVIWALRREKNSRSSTSKSCGLSVKKIRMIFVQFTVTQSSFGCCAPARFQQHRHGTQLVCEAHDPFVFTQVPSKSGWLFLVSLYCGDNMQITKMQVHKFDKDKLAYNM